VKCIGVTVVTIKDSGLMESNTAKGLSLSLSKELKKDSLGIILLSRFTKSSSYQLLK
jgi:hypothetical protein